MSNPCPNATRLSDAERAAKELFGLTDFRLQRLEGGRVNQTFRLDAPHQQYILQRLNDLFQGAQAFGLNWQQVYQTTQDRSGLKSPPLPPIFPNWQGEYLGRLDDQDDYWRLTGFISGHSPAKTPATALAAARLLGRFHTWLNQPTLVELRPIPEGEFTNQRFTQAEDFESLHQYDHHPHLEALKPTLERAAQAAWELPHCPDFLNIFSHHDLVIHGDPKADNFIFSPTGEPLALLDWDSVGYGHELVDIAEMLRSWGGQIDLGSAQIDEIFPAVVTGYAETGLPLAETQIALLPATLRGLALNLARRYLTDALFESYFQWDHRIYPSLHLQNKARGENMLDLAANILDREMELAEKMLAAHRRGWAQRSDH